MQSKGNTVGSHSSELQLSKSSLTQNNNIHRCLHGKYSILDANSIVSLIPTFQLSEHPLVQACSDKWLQPYKCYIKWPTAGLPCQFTTGGNWR